MVKVGDGSNDGISRLASEVGELESKTKSTISTLEAVKLLCSRFPLPVIPAVSLLVEK